jgi:hypothetical protein
MWVIEEWRLWRSEKGPRLRVVCKSSETVLGQCCLCSLNRCEGDPIKDAACIAHEKKTARLSTASMSAQFCWSMSTTLNQ